MSAARHDERRTVLQLTEMHAQQYKSSAAASDCPLAAKDETARVTVTGSHALNRPGCGGGSVPARATVVAVEGWETKLQRVVG